MSYVDEHLNAGEKVAFRTTLHPIVFVAPAILALVALLFAAQRETREFAGYIFLLAVIIGGYLAIQYVTSEFAVTTSRVIIKIGWLSRRTVELQLAKVEGVTVEQGLIGRIFDYGTIIVGGTGGTKEPFKFIRAPIEFRKQVQQPMGATNAAQGPDKGAANVVTATREERECPHCAERILVRATRCRFCGQEVQPSV
jgi:uncharacterized membrane protein YdbT with pleckstrin-like domain